MLAAALTPTERSLGKYVGAPLLLTCFRSHSALLWAWRTETKLMGFHLAGKYHYVLKFLFLLLIVLPMCSKCMK